MGEYGFKKLIVWQNAKMLRKMVYDITTRFPQSEMRRVSQMRDAARSVKQNIQEGYMRNSTAEYIHSLRFSEGSLAELSGDIEDSREDNLITTEEFLETNSLIEKTEYLIKRLIQSLERKKQTDNARKRSSVGRQARQ